VTFQRVGRGHPTPIPAHSELEHQLHRHQHGTVAAHETPLGEAAGVIDLDGTLADSFPWFLRNVNGVADRFNVRRIAENDVEALRHDGTCEIVNRVARHSDTLRYSRVCRVCPSGLGPVFS
jgi:hypothetical protein